MTRTRRSPLYEVRPSTIQGLGVFAARRIRKGTRIIEYLGERISQEEAEKRYDPERDRSGHVLLFMVSAKVVIDGGADGNDAKYINHSCEPNCLAYLQGGRVFFEALRTIEEGDELTYDYQLVRDGEHDPELESRYACLCGVPKCRGTMIGRKPRKRTAHAKKTTPGK